ncbi:hypothetical protein, partial [Staphylococcus aureus]
MNYNLENIMRMLHLIMLVVTKQIWQSIPPEGDTSVNSSWPELREPLIFEES